MDYVNYYFIGRTVKSPAGKAKEKLGKCEILLKIT
jgi:hypothetical protein